MFWPFLLHIIVTAIIFAILASGFKFFVKLKGTLDFSYLAIVIFGAYAGSLFNSEFGLWILASMLLAFLISMLFTLFILYLSSKLDDVYFSIGTLALYILCYQLAFNLDNITWWALGLSGMGRNVIGSISTWGGLNGYLIFSVIIGLLVFIGLHLFKKSYFYRVLQGWGENDTVIKSFGVAINKYKLIMISITTFLAVVGGNLFSFYQLFIDPPSFWLSMLILLLVIIFLSYSLNDWWTLGVSLAILFAYEYLRFFKVVEPSQVWYFREMIFGILIILVSFWVFRRIKFGRAH